MNKLYLIIAIFYCFSLKAQIYQSEWESLQQHNEIPEWFRDAKFGIYFHWGIYSVPEYGNEWYPRWMHDTTHFIYKHHVEKYGDPLKFGYHQFVEQFKAEKFDANAWAELFQKSGAKFAGPVAEHHDGFAMFKTKYSEWNAFKKGPKRDIVQELEGAIKRHNMKFITTFHHNRNWNGVSDLDDRRNYYGLLKRDFPLLLEDSLNAILYGEYPKSFFYEMWKGKLIEVVDQYSPDLIWFDSGLDFVTFDKPLGERAFLEFAAYYYNKASEQNKEVSIVYKNTDIPPNIGIEDYERGGADNIKYPSWLTDDCIARGSWSYVRDMRYYSPNEVFDAFIDRVSKNGQLLLNIAPKSDGTIPQEQKDLLLAFGDWLNKYGESVYSTRPWVIYGEGPTKMGGGHFTKPLACQSEDIRFTRNKENTVLYAIIMDWPRINNINYTIKSLGSEYIDLKSLKNIELLDGKCNIELNYFQDECGLHVTLPIDKPYETMAYPLKLIFKEEIPSYKDESALKERE